jgi:hypothetical protein
MWMKPTTGIVACCARAANGHAAAAPPSSVMKVRHLMSDMVPPAQEWSFSNQRSNQLATERHAGH